MCQPAPSTPAVPPFVASAGTVPQSEPTTAEPQPAGASMLQVYQRQAPTKPSEKPTSSAPARSGSADCPATQTAVQCQSTSFEGTRLSGFKRKLEASEPLSNNTPLEQLSTEYAKDTAPHTSDSVAGIFVPKAPEISAFRPQISGSRALFGGWKRSTPSSSNPQQKSTNTVTPAASPIRVQSAADKGAVPLVVPVATDVAEVEAFSEAIDKQRAQQTTGKLKTVTELTSEQHARHVAQKMRIAREEMEVRQQQATIHEQARAQAEAEAEARQRSLFAAAAKALQKRHKCTQRPPALRDGFDNSEIDTLSVEALVERVLHGAKRGAKGALGLPKSSSAEVIKKRFFALALRLHPDKTTCDKAPEAFTVVEDAYRKLVR